MPFPIHKPALFAALLLLAGVPAARAQAPAAPAPSGPPRQAVTLYLTRYDRPLGFQDQNNDRGRTRQEAARRPGPDAVDWPALSLVSAGGPAVTLFDKEAHVRRELAQRDGAESRPLFRQASDDVLQPGGHWLRAVKWLWGQSYVYTTDRTARSWMSDYELWTFPVRISAPGALGVRSVSLAMDGRTLYARSEPLHSLTLLLPQNEAGRPYQVRVNGGSPQPINVGLAPITPGDPRERVLPVRLAVGGVQIVTPDKPEQFPNEKAWADDVAALGKAAPAAPVYAPTAKGLARHLGLDVPLSPETVNLVTLPHGMSSGGFYNGDDSDVAQAFSKLGSASDFARFLADAGYDRDFERVGAGQMDDVGPGGLYALAGALADRGVRLGLIPGVTWGRPFLAHPNLAFFSAGLPDYHAPLYRDIQVMLARLGRFPNLAGVSLGADNAAYVPYWDWAPPIPNRPWGEAYQAWNGGRTPPVPVAKSLGGTATVKTFQDYVARYDRTFQQYGYFGRAATEMDPALIATTGSFGSSPGVGAGGGWPWASVPGREMYAGLPVQQAYDWNENKSSLPMHQEALLDQLRSYSPRKPTWALIDDFRLLLGRAPRQRAYALALTRGVQAVGTTFLPNPTGAQARPDVVADQKALYAWVHKYGGAYALTEPTPAVGVLFVHPQSLLRPVDQGGQGTPEGRARGGHEGKVTEALFLCHAAGWPAKVITPDELKRGLPPSMKAILLVGLNVEDDSWHWYDGLTPQLQAFVGSGGRLLADDESVCPVPAAKTGMTVRSYVAERDLDWTPTLLARNGENVKKLQAAMTGIAPALAETNSDTVWAVPTVAGDTQYVTVVNQATPLGANASQVTQPQTGRLTWHTDRPIYDVRLGRRLTADEARTVDLAREGFQWYALPPAEVTEPQVRVTRAASGLRRAAVTVANLTPMRGIPVQLTIRRADGSDAATVYSATGLVADLPLSDADPAGAYTVTATELLSGLTGTTTVTIPGTPAEKPLPVVRRGPHTDLAAFARRRDVPLVVALTSGQAADPKVRALAQRLVRFYAAGKRRVTLGRADDTGVVLSLQPTVGLGHYPQWKTVDADLVLLGTASDNVLLLDQARAFLLPALGTDLPAGHAAVGLTFSPFVGERQVLNLLAPDPAGLDAAVRSVIGVRAARESP